MGVADLVSVAFHSLFLSTWIRTVYITDLFKQPELKSETNELVKESGLFHMDL